MHIYTDGSCSQGKAEYTTQAGGWAVVVIGNEDFVIKTLAGGQKGTTNNAMEMTAFINALNVIGEELLKNDFIQGPFYIYSDSAYILNCLNQKWYIKWRQNGWKNAKKEPVKNKELWVELINLYEYITVRVPIEIIKVKGHSGNQWNDLVDEYAVKERKKYE